MKDLLFCNKCKNTSGVSKVNGFRFFLRAQFTGYASICMLEVPGSVIRSQ